MRRIMLAVAIGLLGLPGCGTDPPTPPPLTPSPSATPSAPTAPELPPEAQGSSSKAAKAFVEYYVAVMDHAALTLDTQVMRDASDRDCEACWSIIKSLDEIRGDGGRINFEPTHVLDVRYRSTAPDGTMALSATVEVSSQTLVPSAGADPQVTDGDPNGRYLFDVGIRDGGWVVKRLVIT